MKKVYLLSIKQDDGLWRQLITSTDKLLIEGLAKSLKKKMSNVEVQIRPIKEEI